LSAEVRSFSCAIAAMSSMCFSMHLAIIRSAD
jgi:hypothetical protein